MRVRALFLAVAAFAATFAVGSPPSAASPGGGVLSGTMNTTPAWGPISPFCGSLPCPSSHSWNLTATIIGVHDLNPTFTMTGSGMFNGWCEQSTGAGAVTISGVGSGVITWVSFPGGTIIFNGSVSGGVIYGVLKWRPVVGNCITTPATSFLLAGSIAFDHAGPLPVPPIGPLPPVEVGDPGGATTESSTCTSGNIIDGTTAGVRTLLRVQQQPGRVDVCIRIDDGTRIGIGGRLEVVQGSVSPPPGGPPRTDTSAGACTATTPNSAPGPHPLAGGQIFDPGSPGHVVYILDTYRGAGPAGEEVWLCVGAGAARHRVIIPIAGPGVTQPTVRWRPDPGTPGI